MWRSLGLMVVGSLVVAACSSAIDVTPLPADGAAGQISSTGVPGGEEPETSDIDLVLVDSLFDRASIVVGGERLHVAIADTPEKRSRGLMFVTDMGDLDGMLFMFPDADVRSFWMRNTRLALDIVFFDSAGIPVGGHSMQPCPDTSDDCPGYPSDDPAMFALETVSGAFDFSDTTLDVGTVP